MNMTGRFNCKCIEEGNKALEKQGAYFETALMFCMSSMEEWPTMQIPIAYFKRTKKKVRMAMNYCPVCGTKTGGDFLTKAELKMEAKNKRSPAHLEGQ